MAGYQAKFDAPPSPSGTLGEIIELVDAAKRFADMAGVPQSQLSVRVNTSMGRKVKSLEVSIPRES